MLSRYQKLAAGWNGYPLEHPPWPRVLILDLTSRCNLRCFMCNAHMADPPAGGGHQADMPDGLFRQLEPLIAGARIITLGGCGEPLMSLNIEERLQRIRSLNPGVHLLTFTNGLVLSSADKARALLPFFNEVHLSLNGVESYDRIMTGARFSSIRRNLEYIRDVRQTVGKPEQLVMGFIVMRRNLADIVPAARLAREMGFTRIQYKSLWVFDKTLEAESIHHSQEALAAAKNEVQKARETGFPIECEMWPEFNTALPNNWGLSQAEEGPAPDGRRSSRLGRAGRLAVRDPRRFGHRFGQFIRTCGRRVVLALTPAFTPPPCDYPWTQVQIFENGCVLLCCQGVTEIGDLRQNSFEKIWNGPEAQRYRAGMLTRAYHKDCARCKRIFPDQPLSFEKYEADR